MAEERATNLGRPDVTVTDFLFLLQPSSTIDEYGKVLARSSTKLPYKGTGQLIAEDHLLNLDPAVKARGSLVPEQSHLPTVSAEVRKTPDGGATTVSVRPRDVPVSYSREWNMGVVPSTKDILQGSFGPFGAQFSELRRDVKGDPVETGLGLSANIDLGRKRMLSLSGERFDKSQEARDPRTGELRRDMPYARHLENTRVNERGEKVGAQINLPFAKGIAALNAARLYREVLEPNWKGYPRPTARLPNVTSLGANWQGRLGPGTLGLQGGVNFIRDRGTSSNLGANYMVKDPFGLGGTLKAHAGWQNSYGRPSDLQAGVRYGWRR